MRANEYPLIGSTMALVIINHCYLASLLVVVFIFLTQPVPSIAKRDANQKFKACCARQKLADRQCKRQFCDFNVLSQDNVLHFVNICSAKGSTVTDMWDCVTSKTNHLRCCNSKNVTKECLPYCTNTHAPTDNFSHLLCVQQYGAIRDCFREYLEEHPNIFGDT